VVGGGEIMIGPLNMEVIIKWLVPTNVTKLRIFFGASKYRRKFIASFSIVVVSLHSITISGKSF
jgi:hypothetical protein